MSDRAAISVLIVGAGLMGRWHARAAGRAGGRVVAVIDSSLDRARELAARMPGAAVAGRIEEVAAEPGVAHICTPTPTHGPLARAALEAGWHVLAEKPLAATPDETDTLLALANSRNRLLCPVHQFLFQDGVRDALSHLDAIGPLVQIGFTARSAGAEGCSLQERDRIALEILPHPLSLLTRIVPQDLTALKWMAAAPAPGELRLLADASGVGLSIEISMAGRPPANRLEFVGARGTINVDLFHGFAIIDRGRASRAGKIARPFTSGTRLVGTAGANLARRAWRREPAYPGLTRLVESFYRAVLTGSAPPIAPGETASVARAAAFLAARLAAR